MNSKELAHFLNEILKPLEFKKKGNTWYFENNELKKIVYLQKSNFSNQYYLNYGYIIKKLDYEGLKMHIFNGFGSLNDSENKLINNLLNLEIDITQEQRTKGLARLIDKIMLSELNSINTENDLLANLKSRYTLNDVPLVVKEYFGLK